MMNARLPLLALAVCAVVLSSCERQTFPEPTPPTATFWMKGTLDGEPWEHTAGLDGTFLYTYAEQSEEHVLMESYLADPECEDCLPLIAVNLHAPGNDNPTELLDAGNEWPLTSSTGDALYWGDFEDVLNADYEVEFNGALIEDGEVLVELSPFSTTNYSVYGDWNEFDEFAWSVETFSILEFCPTETLLFPGIELVIEDDMVVITFPEEFEYNSVNLASGYPTANGTYFGGDPIVFPIVDFWPAESLFFSFDPVNPLGLFTTATLEVGAFEWAEIEVPSSAVEPEVFIDEPWAQVYLEIEGESWISHEVCFAEGYPQNAPNGFVFTESEVFEPNEDGLLTRKVTFELEVDLYKEADPDQVRHLVINDGVLAFALPD